MSGQNNFYLSILKFANKTLSGHNITKYSFAKKIQKKIILKAKVQFADIQGSKMHLLPIGHSVQLAMNGIYEPLETNYVKNEIKNGFNVLDIGANIGYYTLIFSKLVGPRGKVFAFEPEQKIYNILKKNVKINNYENVIIENLALSNKFGKTSLYISEAGGSTIFPLDDDNREKREISKTSLDKYFENLQHIPISFIKMDAEGSEFAILQGMELLLKNNKKLKMLIEFNPKLIKQSGANPRDLLVFLIKQNFKIFFTTYHPEKIEQMKSIDSLLELITTEKNLTNLICERE